MLLYIRQESYKLKKITAQMSKIAYPPPPQKKKIYFLIVPIAAEEFFKSVTLAFIFCDCMHYWYNRL